MQEDDVDTVHEPAALQLAVRVPQHHLEGVVVDYSAPIVQHLSERDAFHRRGGQVVHWDVLRPATQRQFTSGSHFLGESVVRGQ